MAVSKFNITADSIPVYDGLSFADYWADEDWQKWHGLVKSKYGAKFAADRFHTYWNGQSSWAYPYNWGKYDTDFVNYLTKEGIDIGDFISKPLVGITSAVGSAGTAIGNTGKAAENTTKMLKIGIPIFVGLLMLIILFVAYKKMSKATI